MRDFKRWHMRIDAQSNRRAPLSTVRGNCVAGGLGCERCAVVKTATELYVRSTIAGIWSGLISHNAQLSEQRSREAGSSTLCGNAPAWGQCSLPIRNLFVAIANSGDWLSLLRARNCGHAASQPRPCWSMRLLSSASGHDSCMHAPLGEFNALRGKPTVQA